MSDIITAAVLFDALKKNEKLLKKIVDKYEKVQGLKTVGDKGLVLKQREDGTLVTKAPRLLFDKFDITRDANGYPENITFYYQTEEVLSVGLELDASNYLKSVTRKGAEQEIPLELLPFFINWIDVIRQIRNIQNIESIDLIDDITDVGTVNLINTVNLIKTISSITEVANVTSVDLIDKITLIDAITNIGTVSNVTNLGTLNLLNTVNLIKTISSITNIANVVSVDLIDEITKIGEISKIRDITLPRQSLILNSSFEQGFAGWFHSDPAPILDDTQKAYVGENSMKFPASLFRWIDQTLPIAIDSSWFTALKFYLRASSIGNAIRLYYYDVDGGTDSEIFAVTAANTWELKTITKPDKAFWGFGFSHDSAWARDSWLDNIFMVF